MPKTQCFKSPDPQFCKDRVKHCLDSGCLTGTEMFQSSVISSQRLPQELSERIGLNIFTDPFYDDKAVIICVVQHSKGFQISQASLYDPQSGEGSELQG